MRLTIKDQVLLGRLLVAVCAVLVRSSPVMRGQIVHLLARDHADELVSSVIAKLG